MIRGLVASNLFVLHGGGCIYVHYMWRLFELGRGVVERERDVFHAKTCDLLKLISLLVNI